MLMFCLLLWHSQVKGIAKELKQLSLPASDDSVAPTASTVPGSTAGAAGSESDSDDSFKEGEEAEGDASDPRDCPPCYKAQHAASRQLVFQLQYELTCAQPLKSEADQDA